MIACYFPGKPADCSTIIMDSGEQRKLSSRPPARHRRLLQRNSTVAQIPGGGHGVAMPSVSLPSPASTINNVSKCKQICCFWNEEIDTSRPQIVERRIYWNIPKVKLIYCHYVMSFLTNNLSFGKLTFILKFSVLDTLLTNTS